MRSCLIGIVSTVLLVTGSFTSRSGAHADAPYTIPFAELVRVIDASICAGQKGWNAPCEPQQLTLAVDGPSERMVTSCPTCLTALTVQGPVAAGRIRLAQGDSTVESAFRTQAPSAAELAALASRLYAHHDARYFTQAARPRGLSLDEGALLVADFGTGDGDGRVWRVPVRAAGEPLVASVEGEAVAAGLPSVSVATDFQGQPFKAIVGIAAVRRFGDGFVAVVNRVVGKRVDIPELRGFPVSALLRIDGTARSIGTSGRGPEEGNGLANSNGGHATEVLASLVEFESRYDPDGDGVESNPHDLVVRDGQIYATDAAGNSVLRVDARTGAASLYAVFTEIPNAESSAGSPAAIDAVPTGLEFGPDGALYVASLGGFPFASGSGRIIRLVDANGDGDALDAGEQTVVVSGLTMPIDVTFDQDGRMYTAEHSLAFASQGPGRICRIEHGRCGHVLTDNAAGPTSLVVSGEYVYYSQEFLGRVGRLRIPER